MKIVFMIPCMLRGGAERVMSILCNSFVDKENDVILILTEESKSINYQIDKKVKIVDATSKQKNTFYKLFCIQNNINHILREEKPDIVISFITRVNISAIRSCRRYHIPVIVSERNNPYNVPANRLFRRIRDYYYQKANGIVFQTNYAKNYFSKKIQEKSVVIINPVSNQVHISDTLEKDDKRVISVGRLEEQKNMKLLIEAFNIIKNQITGFKLYIFGDGSKKKELEEIISKYSLNDKVFLMGQSDNVIQEVKKSKVFVISSDYEGMSNALLEAMCSGVACVATDSPAYGNRDLIIDGYNGYLVPVGDTKALSEKIKELCLNDYKNNLFSQRAKEVYERANADLIVEKWVKYTNAVIKCSNSK